MIENTKKYNPLPNTKWRERQGSKSGSTMKKEGLINHLPYIVLKKSILIIFTTFALIIKV